MKRVIGFFSGVITFIGCFHLYLNFTNNKEVSLEKTINILKAHFTDDPVKTVSIIILIILISIIVSFAIDKFIQFTKSFFIGKTKPIDLEQVQNIKTQVFEKMLNQKVPLKDALEEPWKRINYEFERIILRDIGDKKFPDLGKWSRYEIYNLTKEGIEFFDPSNISGFKLLFDEKYYWDVFHNQIKPKKKNYFSPARAYCIDFLAFEDINRIDWEYDEYFSCITIYCEFKYCKNFVKHPFKEFRYYVLEAGILTLLENKNRSNFKRLIWRVIYSIYEPYKRFRNYYQTKKIIKKQPPRIIKADLHINK